MGLRSLKYMINTFESVFHTSFSGGVRCSQNKCTPICPIILKSLPRSDLWWLHREIGESLEDIPDHGNDANFAHISSFFSGFNRVINSVVKYFMGPSKIVCRHSTGVHLHEEVSYFNLGNYLFWK